jgi:hypothetical protein
MPLKTVAELILTSATPLYLREIDRRLDQLLPMIERMRVFEHYGVVPTEKPGPPLRIHAGNHAVLLDPNELAALLAKTAPLLHQLTRYGLKQTEILAMVPPYRSQMHERKSSKRPA